MKTVTVKVTLSEDDVVKIVCRLMAEGNAPTSPTSADQAVRAFVSAHCVSMVEVQGYVVSEDFAGAVRQLVQTWFAPEEPTHTSVIPANQ